MQFQHSERAFRIETPTFEFAQSFFVEWTRGRALAIRKRRSLFKDRPSTYNNVLWKQLAPRRCKVL